MADKKTTEAVKKIILQQKPDAYFSKLNEKNISYYTRVDMQAKDNRTLEQIYFMIPMNEIAGAEFTSVMPAHTLLRWLVLE